MRDIGDTAMADRMGSRLKLGLLVPAFNASTQPEMEAMRPPGVTNHVARIAMADHPLSSDADQELVLQSIGEDLYGALGRVMQVRPGAVILGISISCLWGGLETGPEIRRRMEAAAGVPVATADAALLTALRKLPQVRSVGILTPFQPVADGHVRRFFELAGYRVTTVHSMKAPSNLEIAHADEKTIVSSIRTIAATGCDAVVHVGTNLAAGDLLDEAERWLDLPCLGINALLYWHALRLAGLDDPIHGFGRFVAAN